MAKAKKSEVKSTEGQKTVDALRAEIVALQMTFSKGQLKNTTQLRTKKDELARMLTRLSMEKFAKTETSKSVRQAQDGKEEVK